MPSIDVTNKLPGVFVQKSVATNPVAAATSVASAAMLGITPMGPVDTPVLCETWDIFKAIFGDTDVSPAPTGFLGNTIKHVRMFFTAGGSNLWFTRVVHRISNVSTAAAGYTYLYSTGSVPSVDPSTVVVTAGVGNTGDPTVAFDGAYLLDTDEDIQVKVTTGGDLDGTCIVDIIKDPLGTPSTIMADVPVYDGVPISILGTGLTVTFTAVTTAPVTDDVWDASFTATTLPYFRFDAFYPGEWINGYEITISAPSNGVASEFKLELKDDSAASLEVFDNLSLDSSKFNYWNSIVNGAAGSDYFRMSLHSSASGTLDTDATSEFGAGEDGLGNYGALVADDFIGDSTAKTGIYAYDRVRDRVLFICPEMEQIDSETWIETVYDYITADGSVHQFSECIGLVPYTGTYGATGLSDEVAQYAYAETFRSTAVGYDSEKVWLYFNWLIWDGVPVSPLSYVAAKHIEAFTSRGYSDAGAGTRTVLPALPTEIATSYGLLIPSVDSVLAGRLNERSINVIMAEPGIGIYINGSRSLAVATSDVQGYIGAVNAADAACHLVRERFRDIPHRKQGPSLWSEIAVNATAILESRFSNDFESILVKCDSTTNTAKSQRERKIICEIWIKPFGVAEFMIFNVNVI